MQHPGRTYAYVMIILSILVLAWSLWAMYSAASFYQQGKIESFYFYIVASAVAVMLAFSSILQMRRRLNLLYLLATRVLTIVVCTSCGFKVIRTFTAGDYIHKEVGTCEQCKGPMRINAIYREEKRR
jgi:cell division protein FtsW (lipid II flippase)